MLGSVRKEGQGTDMFHHGMEMCLYYMQLLLLCQWSGCGAREWREEKPGSCLPRKDSLVERENFAGRCNDHLEEDSTRGYYLTPGPRPSAHLRVSWSGWLAGWLAE